MASLVSNSHLSHTSLTSKANGEEKGFHFCFEEEKRKGRKRRENKEKFEEKFCGNFSYFSYAINIDYDAYLSFVWLKSMCINCFLINFD